MLLKKVDVLWKTLPFPPVNSTLVALAHAAPSTSGRPGFPGWDSLGDVQQGLCHSHLLCSKTSMALVLGAGPVPEPVMLKG